MANATPNLTRKTLVLAATEATYGTAVTPNQEASISSQAMLLFDEVNPLSMDVSVVEKQVVRASLTKNTNLIGRRLYNVKPKTMLSNAPGYQTQGSYSAKTGVTATSGTPPFFSPLLRACALKETNGGTSIVYAPRSSSFESATCVVYADSIKHTVAGCVGTFTMEGTGGEGIELMFDLKGKYSAPVYSSTGLPTVTYPADEKTLCASEQVDVNNGSSYTPIVRSFKFDLGNTTVERKDANSAFGLYGLYITDRKPTFELVVEVDQAGTGSSLDWDPWSNLASSSGVITTHTVKLLHGPADSNAKNVGMRFATLQLKDVQYQDDGGIRTYALSYDVTSSSDDAEFYFRFGAITYASLT